MLVMLAVIFLTACNSQDYSFNKVMNIPKEANKKTESGLRLQLIQDKKNISYIVYRGGNNVKADLEPEGETLKVNFSESAEGEESAITYVYRLKKESKYNTIEVLINGESVGFDNVTG